MAAVLVKGTTTCPRRCQLVFSERLAAESHGSLCQRDPTDSPSDFKSVNWIAPSLAQALHAFSVTRDMSARGWRLAVRGRARKRRVLDLHVMGHVYSGSRCPLTGPSSRHRENPRDRPIARSSSRCRCSDRSNLGKQPDCVLVVPADGGFPMRPMLVRRCHAQRRRRDRRRCRAAPDRDRGRPTCDDSSQSISQVYDSSNEPAPTLAPSNALQMALRQGRSSSRSPVCRRSVDDRQPGRCGQSVNRCSRRSMSVTRRQSASVSGGPPSTYVITTRPSCEQPCGKAHLGLVLVLGSIPALQLEDQRKSNYIWSARGPSTASAIDCTPHCRVER